MPSKFSRVTSSTIVCTWRARVDGLASIAAISPLPVPSTIEGTTRVPAARAASIIACIADVSMLPVTVIAVTPVAAYQNGEIS